MSWDVINVQRAEPSPERGTVRAVALELEQGHEHRRLTVELAGAAPVVRGDLLQLRDEFEQLLDEEEPPRRVIVTMEGAIAAVE